MPSNSHTVREVPLPLEVISRILSFIPRQERYQRTLWACSLVSRIWYGATVPLLYERPYLRGGNFQDFVGTICPSKNARIKMAPLAELVKKLDMGYLVHDGSKSLTARLLGRLKHNLTEFVAPQASFSINSFAALAKCSLLTHLNLSLMSASVSHSLLFQTLGSLTRLEILFFPRTAAINQYREVDPYSWPPNLRALHLAGGIDDFFLECHLCNAPSSLSTLSIQHCPKLSASALETSLKTLGPQLKHLTIRHPMSKLDVGSLDSILLWCPSLEALRISADYITDWLFGPGSAGKCSPLRILDLDCSDSPSDQVAISPDFLWCRIEDGTLPDLRSVRVSARLGWQDRHDSVSDLVDLLEEQEQANPLGIETGVWTFVS